MVKLQESVNIKFINFNLKIIWCDDNTFNFFSIPQVTAEWSYILVLILSISYSYYTTNKKNTIIIPQRILHYKYIPNSTYVSPTKIYFFLSKHKKNYLIHIYSYTFFMIIFLTTKNMTYCMCRLNFVINIWLQLNKAHWSI